MNWIEQNWAAIVGGGSLTSIVTYIFNRKSSRADFLTKVEDIYNGLADRLKLENEELKIEVQTLKNDFRELQKQFNCIQLSYTDEVNNSKIWRDKFNNLEKKYNVLEKDHESLKKEFSNYKKKHENK
jgi:predicted RNase H-like nuclease (RuvC/YqgF family)